MNNKLIGDESNIIFYEDENNNTKVEVRLLDEDVWLNVNAIADLFNVQRPAIVKHISNIYNDQELEKVQLVPFWNKFNLKEIEEFLEKENIIILI